jgi:AraC-like DNA-binding protein
MSIEIRRDNVLLCGDEPSPFVIKKAEDMRLEIATVPHRHSYYTVLWSFNEAGRHVVDTHTFPFRPQTIWFIAPGEVHCIEPPQPQGVMFLFIPELFPSRTLDSGFLDKLSLFRSHGHPIALSDDNAAALMNHTVAITDAFFSTDTFRMERIGAHLKLFLLECNELLVMQKRKPAKNEPLQHPAVAAFKKMVAEHLHEWHKVDDYAGALCLSSHYLSELFGQATGQSPKEYISAQITAEAKRLALFSSLSVKEIGFRLGFDDPARFSRFFKQHTGFSFQTFRQSII